MTASAATESSGRPLGEAIDKRLAQAEQISAGGAVFFFEREQGAGEGLRAEKVLGIDDAQLHQRAVNEALPHVEACLTGGQVITGAPLESLGRRSAGGFWAVPLRVGAKPLGALAIASPALVQGSARGMLLDIAEIIALHLDRACATGRELTDDEDADEVLRLSEALFAQDIALLESEEKLGQVDKLKSDFIEKMSRELRTPLNGIIEAIIAVLAGENENLGESGKLALRGALDDGTSFLRTLQNILDLWQIRQQHLTPECQEVSFREVVEEAIFSVQDTLAGKPVEIYKQLQDPYPKIRTDLARISQVLYLILDNAVKFTEAGRIEIESSVADETLICSVRDTGVGICHDDQPLVFDDFFQVDDTQTSAYRGSGLGLALVRELVDLMGGSVSLSSEIAEGTEVTLRLPVQVVG
ncbi:MAG: HAMP domain-containing histidine kinase [Myxococcales bacterium]|nr:HAMP domain-containing histidine kinase [Myxococcales bacterium]